jgi:hypothetical protein
MRVELVEGENPRKPAVVAYLQQPSDSVSHAPGFHQQVSRAAC